MRLLPSDFPAAFGFYRDKLGFPVGFGDEESGYAEFDAGGSIVALFDRAEQEAVVDLRPPGDGVVVAFGVDSLDDTVQELRRRGASLDGEPQARPDWGIRFVHLCDPDGNLIELQESIPMSE